jgi:hypothetical protein
MLAKKPLMEKRGIMDIPGFADGLLAKLLPLRPSLPLLLNNKTNQGSV